MSLRLHGCIPIVVTPFDPSFAIDEASLRAEVEYLIAGGVHGLATPAIASEGYKLTEQERADRQQPAGKKPPPAGHLRAPRFE